MKYILGFIGSVCFSVSSSLLVRIYNKDPKISPSLIACLTEACKLVIVCSVSKCMCRKWPFRSPVRWGFFVNALLYVVTNTLTIVILEHVNAGLFLVLSQHKILLIVFLSRLILYKKYSMLQWISCVILALGISLTQYKQDHFDLNFVIMSLVFIQGLSASFAGVWTEKMMTSDLDDDQPVYSFFCDSTQLYLFGLPIYCLQYVVNPGIHSLSYNHSCILVLNTSVAGVFIGSVIKFYSMVSRCFVNGIAIVISIYISWAYMNEIFTIWSVIGTILVVFSTVLFYKFPLQMMYDPIHAES